MAGNIARVCLARLDTLPTSGDPGADPDSTGLIALIADGPAAAARQANLYLMMRRYLLVERFMLDVVGAKYATLDYSLTRMDVNAFFTAYQLEHEEAACWSESTAGKSKQVLRACLVETGQLESARSETLIPILLAYEVERAMRACGDAHMLPAFNCLELG